MACYQVPGEETFINFTNINEQDLPRQYSRAQYKGAGGEDIRDISWVHTVLLNLKIRSKT